jgi:hypothetical protein
MPLLDEDTAFSLADRLSLLPPERHNPNEVKSLFEYKQHQQELGLPLFPSQEAKAREMNTQYRNIFTDIKKVDEFAPSMAQIAATSPDPDKTRQMFANHAFLAKELGKPMEEVQANYNEWMGGYSQQVWGKRVADTAGFYGMAQGHVKKQIEQEEVSGEAMRLALTSAAMGTNDSVGDYQKWKASMAGKANMEDAYWNFSVAYGQVKAQIEGKKHIVAGAVKSLKQLMAGEGATSGTEQRIVDAIVDMDPKERPLVLAAIMAGAQATGEGADKDWTTLFPQIGESFSRIINASWGGMGRQELETNLRTAKAEYLGGKDGKMLLPESPIETPEQARELVVQTLGKVAGRTMGQTMLALQGQTPTGGVAEGTKRFREPTEQERRLINSEMNRVTRTNQITREIENAAVATDPVKALFANAIGSTLALVPVSMMGPGGVMVATKAYAGMEYDKIRLQYPTIPEDKVAIISNLSGFVMAGLDKIEGDFLTGKLPSVSKIIQKGIFSTVLGRVGIRAVEGVTFQNLQEGFQDASRLVIQDIAAAIDSDIEGTDLSEYSQFWDSRLDVAIDMIPLNLIGLGAGTYQDFANATATMQRRDLLNLAGINDEAAGPIIELARKGDVEGAQTALREAFLNRDPEVARAASERMGPAEVATQQFDTNLTRSLAPRYTQEGDNHTLTFPDGRVIKAESWSEARWYMEQAMGDTLNQEISTVAELGNFFTSQQREGMTETLDVVPEQRTMQQDVAEGVITEEQARERAAIAGEAFGLTPEEAQEEAWTVLGRNTTDTQNDVAQSAIQLFEGADVNTVVEEVVEGRLKAALAQNKYSTEQVKKFIAQVESATGETFMSNDTEQGITEAISAIVVADVLGRRKDGTQLPAGLVTRGMLAAVQRQSTPKANRRLMGMVQAFRSFFRQVFARAKALNKAKGEGKLGAEYQGFVDELLGVDPQVRELNVAAVEARAMVGTATGSRPQFFASKKQAEDAQLKMGGTLQKMEGSGWALIPDTTVTAVEETQQTPMEKQAASSLKLGAIVRYNGYVGRLEQEGQRFVVRAPDQEVELTGEDLVEVVLERDPATTRELFVKELGATEVNLVEGKFTPAPSGLAIISPKGVRLVPQNRTLSKNVVQTPDGMAFRVLDPAKGRITLLTGQQAQQAMDAMLEAAGRQEAAGQKVSYALAPAKFSEQVMTELEQQLGKDPAQRWAYGVEIQRRLAKLSTEVDQMAAADLTSKQRKDQQEQFVREKFDELVAQMPPNQPVEELEKVMAQAKKEGEAWAAQNKADAPGQRERIIGYQRIVNAALMGLPKNLRTDIGGFLQVADARSATTALKAIKKHIARIGETVERYLKEEIQAEVKALIKRGKPNMKAGEKPSSDIGAEASNLFAVAAQAIKMSREEVDAAIAVREAEIDNTDKAPTPDREQQLRDEVEMLRLAGDFKNADAAQSKALLDSLEDLFTEGREQRQQKRDRDKAKIERLKDMLKMEVSTRLGIDSVQGLQAAIAQQRTKGTLSTWWDVGLLEGGSINTLLYKLVGDKSEVGKELLNMERKADNDYQDLNDAMEQDITAFFTRIGNGDAVQGQLIVAAMDVNTKKGWRWKKVKDMGQTPVRHTIKVPGKADAVEVTSQMEAIHDLMMWRQPDGKRSMSGKFNEAGERTSTWGYDEDWANSVMGQLTPEAWQVMDWLTQRYQAEGVFLDPLVRDRLGVMMPANPIYSPLTNVSEQVKPGQMQDPISGAVVTGTVGITPTALKTRNKSINRPRKASALQVYIGHTKQMNHWVAKHDYARTIQQIFLNRDMLDYVLASGGEIAQKLVIGWVDHAVAGGIRDSTVQLEFSKWFDRMGSRAAQAAILGRASTLMVQTTQLGAASMKMPMRDYVRMFGKLMRGQLDWKATMESPFIQRRIAQKSPLVQLATRADLGTSVPSNLKYSQRWFAEALTDSDAYVTAATHTMLYHHQLEVAESMGMTGAEAQEYAASEADRLTEEVAQPVRQSQRSMIELNKKFSLISPFISEARQKLSLLFVALDKVKQDPSWDNWGELARVSNYLFFVNGMFVQAIKKGWLLARTPADDRPEIDIGEMMLMMAAESLASPLTGAPGFQFLTEGGSLLSALPRAGGAFKRVSETLLTDEDAYEGDPVKMMRDADLLISAMALFSDSAAVMSSYSHVFTDLAKLIDAQIQD